MLEIIGSICLTILMILGTVVVVTMGISFIVFIIQMIREMFEEW